MSAVIELQGVAKRYQKLEEPATLLRSLVPMKRPPAMDLWALRDISLQVQQGETVGIVGHNGAGKTTLLRLLAGVTRPSLGHLRVEGRIAPLIGLGVGFHEEMSGRENVIVNGMLLGLSAKQVLKRFDEIVEFSELESFIDTPVKFYSSGMFMRLGFSVLAHIDPTILLIDEILAVGDARFRLKCFERLRLLEQEGAVIILVSHAEHMIRRLCRRGVLIQHGQMQYDGDVDTALTLHQRSFDLGADQGTRAPVRIMFSRFVGSQSSSLTVGYDEVVELEARVRFHQEVADPVILVGAVTGQGLLAGFNVTPAGRAWRTFAAGEESAIRISFRARLAGGTYRVGVEIRDHGGVEKLAIAEDLMLTVEGRHGSEGISDVCAEIEPDEPLVLSA